LADTPLKLAWPSNGSEIDMTVSYKTQQVGDVSVFYREAGAKGAPVILLLHGFPSSSHMFRDLIPLLAENYRVIAPDLPGFGHTQAPGRGKFDYTFDNLAKVIDGFTQALCLERYAFYVFDYGAPTGFRLAAAHPERVTALISQNGNAYLDGFSAEWGPWETYWRDPSPENREACRASLSADVIENWQYRTGTDPSRLSPDGFTLDIALMGRPGAQEIQLDLILDYRTNLERYPEFQKYFREHQPPFLAVWGRHDPAFIPAGADAFKRDLPKAHVHLLDTGHFALETHGEEIGQIVQSFLGQHL
jgi:pimeloyl-ACP methyl ester carboxylesterase